LKESFLSRMYIIYSIHLLFLVGWLVIAVVVGRLSLAFVVVVVVVVVRALIA